MFVSPLPRDHPCALDVARMFVTAEEVEFVLPDRDLRGRTLARMWAAASESADEKIRDAAFLVVDELRRGAAIEGGLERVFVEIGRIHWIGWANDASLSMLSDASSAVRRSILSIDADFQRFSDEMWQILPDEERKDRIQKLVDMKIVLNRKIRFSYNKLELISARSKLSSTKELIKKRMISERIISNALMDNSILL